MIIHEHSLLYKKPDLYIYILFGGFFGSAIRDIPFVIYMYRYINILIDLAY